MEGTAYGRRKSCIKKKEKRFLKPHVAVPNRMGGSVVPKWSGEVLR